jgi:diguanylate cyclase (GGDEF)-like protein
VNLSFRFRLRLFFVVIVLVPMVTLAVVLFSVVAGSEEGKSDARLGQAQRTASGLFQTMQRRARRAAERIGGDQRLATAVAGGRRPAIAGALEDLAERERMARAVLRLRDRGLYSAGSLDAVAPVTTPVTGPRGGKAGELTVAAVTAPDLAEEISRLTGMEAVILQGGRTLATTLPDADVALPLEGTASVGARDFRVASFSGPSVEGEDVSVRVLSDQRGAGDNVSGSTAVVAVVLLLFLALAFAFAFAVSRSLQAQIGRLLAAARRLALGDFDVEVPTDGSDEFAQLGTEFNQMARELQSRLQDLQNEQARLQLAVRRVGDSFARGLDREALLDLAVQTAVDGVGARCGRATVRDGGTGLREVAAQGDSEGLERAMHAAELAALETWEGVETQMTGTNVLTEPLVAEGEQEVLGLLTVARRDEPFSATERDLFRYLAAQAAISIENADLHHMVRRQAVTDELTGLFNHRHFQEVLSAEVERARRYGHPLALIMLDLDNFKDVNDTHGHMQGDRVLREVARVLRETARDVDEPARYGGEELAVVLPQTDLGGAHHFGERVRRAIEALEIRRVDGQGVLRVTASVGVAALAPGSSMEKDELVIAADAALYRAKRAGRNRTMRAPEAIGRERRELGG